MVKTITIFLVALILIGNVSAKENQDIIKEEIVGVTDDGSDFIIKKTITHPINPNPQSKKSTLSSCYKLMGVSWKQTPVNYVIDPTNSGLDESTIFNVITTSAETWDTATIKELFNSPSIDTSAQFGVRDNINAIVFGDNYPDPSTIAVTSIWGTYFGKRILEFDVSLETNYPWGINDPAKMDVQNIVTHELGHAIGLLDLYNRCEGETMYGYSTFGEISKRDLNIGDIAGVRRIYGG